MTSEVPPELLDPDAPPGTPTAAQADGKLAPVFCRHGTRWEHDAGNGGYVAEDAEDPEQLGHDIPAREVGAIPEPCQPTTVWDPADKPEAVERRELVEEALAAEGLDPGSPAL